MGLDSESNHEIRCVEVWLSLTQVEDIVRLGKTIDFRENRGPETSNAMRYLWHDRQHSTWLGATMTPSKPSFSALCHTLTETHQGILSRRRGHWAASPDLARPAVGIVSASDRKNP